ncbi:WD40/YVTN/BNR-like repeat-containing protein [Niveispirillum fermenti]|uniref:WD40/YVTN/BNR-like repeat-containing protein n=1 Tax=Niveispirillum fermenti TaxID=1233113 RepID=UPI003A8A3B87
MVCVPLVTRLLAGGLCLLAAGLLPAAAQEARIPALRPAVMAPLAVHSLILGAARAGDRLVAVGERGHILLSDDNGASWRQVAVPANAALTGVAFADDRQGWAVGHDAVILHTADAGETWQVQYAEPELEQPLMDVLFSADGRHGIAVGAYGLYLETADGGATWESRMISDSDFHFNAIVAPTPESRLIAGEAGTTLVSTDAGATWTPLAAPYDGSFFDALALGPQSFLVYGLQGNILRTDDAGQTWTAIDSGTTAGLMGGAVLADGSVVLVGAQGTVLTSKDGGRTFSGIQRPDRVGLADVIQAAGGQVILLGEAGPLTANP